MPMCCRDGEPLFYNGNISTIRSRPSSNKTPTNTKPPKRFGQIFTRHENQSYEITTHLQEFLQEQIHVQKAWATKESSE